MHVYIFRYRYVCACGEQKAICVIFLYHPYMNFFSLPEFLRQGFSLSLELTESAILSVQGAPGILLSSKDYRHMPPHSSYMDAGDLNVSPHSAFPVPQDYVFV